MPSRRRCVIKQLKPVANDLNVPEQFNSGFQREAATAESLGEGSDQIPKLYACTEMDGLPHSREWIQAK